MELMRLLCCLVVAFAGAELPKGDFRHISYPDIHLDVDTFSQDGITTYSQLLFDVARNQVLVGARDMLFRLSLPHLNLLENASWTSPDYKTAMCLTKGQSEENCHNYIKVLLTNGRGVFTCGTNSFSPSCTWREIENLNAVIEGVEGVARCPYNPSSNITALLTERGDYYVGGPTDFSGSDFAIYRSIGKHTSIRTKQYNSIWLNEPQFVASFETDKFVYFLFREAAVEYINCGKIIYSRIARVCKNDAGGQVMLKDNWTTFIKARLNCSISGDYPFYFNEIQSAVYIAEENILYATFTTPSNSIAGSAICAFNMSEINKAFSGAFKHREHVGSAWSKHYSTNQDHFECLAQPHSKNLVESSKYQLMDSAVQASTLKPLYQANLERFTHITVDVLSTKLHSTIHVIFVATQDGYVKKLTALPNEQEACLVEVWKPVPDSNVPILSMQYLKDTNSIYIGTQREVMRIPAHHCSRHVSKESCLNAMDPYCGWYDVQDACTVAPTSDSFEKYWEQNVTKCPVLDARVDGGWSSWSKIIPCSHRSMTDPDTGDECLCQTRQCNNPSPQNGGRPCEGNSISVTNCTVHGGWTAWSAWSECSATCGVAVKTRTRTCTNPAPQHRGRVCVGQDRSEVLCTGNPPCPVATPTPQDGGWSEWDSWSPCSITCGGDGFKSRTRRCNNPPPLSGGIDCTGTNIEFETCRNSPCPEARKISTLSINYTNANNDVIYRKFKYICKAPVQNNLIKLTHKEEYCRGKHCDDEQPHWSQWGEWTVCSVTCGSGQQVRERKCESRNGDCVGQSMQTRMCHMQPCISEWGCWSEWSPCSSTCGWGIRKRYRPCLNSNCKGNEMQEEPCETTCGSLLGWSDWTEWSVCDDNNLQYRKRLCRTANPGQQMCQGPANQSRICIDANSISNDINVGSSIPIVAASAGEITVYIIIGMVFGYPLGLMTHYLYVKRKKTKLPSSPHYMSAKSNPYIAVPFNDRPSKRQTSSSSHLPNNIQNGTLKSRYEYDTIRRNSHGLNNGSTKMEILDDKFYE